MRLYETHCVYHHLLSEKVFSPTILISETSSRSRLRISATIFLGKLRTYSHTASRRNNSGNYAPI